MKERFGDFHYWNSLRLLAGNSTPAQIPRLGNCIPTQPSRKREGFILYRELYYYAC